MTGARTRYLTATNPPVIFKFWPFVSETARGESPVSGDLFFFAVKLAELRTSACTNGIAAVRTIYDTKD